MSAPERDTMSTARYRQLIRKLRQEEGDRERLSVLKAQVRRYNVTQKQANGAIAQFKSRSYKRKASHALSGRVVDDDAG